MYFKGYGKGVNFKGYAGGGKGGAGKSWPAPREDGSGVRQFAPGFTPRKMCIHFPQGKCSRGAGCTFAHSLDELSPDSPELAGRTDSQDAEAGVEESMMAEQTAAAEAEAAAEAAAEADAEAAAQAAEEELLAAEQTEAELAADDADAAMDEGSGAGLLEGPREFVEAPQSLCASWLQHPSLCAQGDQCTLAHGLAELGSISESALFMKFDGPDSIACEVRPADVEAGAHSAAGHGKSGAHSHHESHSQLWPSSRQEGCSVVVRARRQIRALQRGRQRRQGEGQGRWRARCCSPGAGRPG